MKKPAFSVISSVIGATHRGVECVDRAQDWGLLMRNAPSRQIDCSGYPRRPKLRQRNTKCGTAAGAFGTFAALAFPTLALAADNASLLPRNLSPWGMFVNADIVVQAVMVGLALASLVTWTVWLSKTLELRRANRQAQQRLAAFETETSLPELARDSADATDAVAQLIQSAAREASLSGATWDAEFKERIALRLERTEAAMSRRIARGTGVLATIGAVAPFVGLFGTVWGIMNAFIGISQAHTTNLAVVAPGIAEALLATALGLVAAIPAVVIYNHLARVIAGYRALLGDASAQLLLLLSRSKGRPTARFGRAAE
jgi:biopolymer transport protein ExbB